MRSAIKSKLVAELPGISGRCYDAHEPAAATVKPYIVVKRADEVWELAWTGMRRNFDIAVYADWNSFQTVDSLMDEVIAALHRARLQDGDGRFFTCMYEGAAEPDGMDVTGQLIFRIARFSVKAVRFDPAAAEAQADPWLTAISDWTLQQTGDGWHVYRHCWPQSYEPRAVLWRTDRVEIQDKGAAVTELNRRLVAHVIAPTIQEQQEMLVLLATRLGELTKLSAGTGKYAAVSKVASDVQAEAFSFGQLSVTLTAKARQTAEAGPLIAAIHTNGTINR